MDEEEIVVVEETTEDYQDNAEEDASNRENEAEEKAESGKQHKAESPEARRARIKRQYEREFGKTDKETDKEGGKESNEKEVDERYTRLELKTEGVTSKKAQDIVLEYAKWKKIDALDALKSPIVRAEIAELEKKTSVPAPSKRTNGGATETFDYWVGQAKKGHFPTHDPKMMEQLKKARIFTR